MFGAENREKTALVLDNHAGAKLCRFRAAHTMVWPRTGVGAGTSPIKS
jgi:hypothetical protein